jgi:hypothetical protein
MEIYQRKIFNRLSILITVVVMLIFVCINVSYANMVSVLTSDDTFITEHANLGGKTSIHGSDDFLYICRGTGVYRTFPLLWFDLSQFAGGTVNGSTAELRLELIGSWNNTNVSQSVSVRELQSNWTEATTSFSNFGNIGFNESIHTGNNLTTRNVSYNGSSEFISFIIPSSIIQNWIDDPTTNYGLILISNTTLNQTDLKFASSEGFSAPMLYFDVTPVPVPSSMFLLFSGLLLFFGAIYRIKQMNFKDELDTGK